MKDSRELLKLTGTYLEQYILESSLNLARTLPSWFQMIEKQVQNSLTTQHFLHGDQKVFTWFWTSLLAFELAYRLGESRRYFFRCEQIDSSIRKDN